MSLNIDRNGSVRMKKTNRLNARTILAKYRQTGQIVGSYW